MTPESQQAVGSLLRAIEARDLPAMERDVQVLRKRLAVEPSSDAERADAMAVAAEEIELALHRMRMAAAGEMARIRAAAPLLAHVALENASV